MPTSPRGADELVAAQAVPEQTVNENFRHVEAGACHFPVADRVTAPPGSCADGANYIIIATATGAFATKENQIATALGTNAANGWRYHVPIEGFTAYVQDESARYLFGGASWALDTTGGSYTDEEARDAVAAALTSSDGSLVITPDDGADEIDITLSTGFVEDIIAGAGGSGEPGYQESAVYWRLRTTAAGSGGGVEYGEVVWSRNGFAIVDSSTYTASTEDGSHPAEDAHDASLATYYAYDGIEAAIGSWWKTQFTVPYIADEVFIRPPTGRQAQTPEGIEVEYSLNNMDWTSVATLTPTWATDAGQTFPLDPTQTIAFLTTAAVLDDLADVNAPTPSDGDVLTWDDGAGEWVPDAPASGGASTTQTTECIAGFIASPSDKSYKIVVKAPHGGTITETTTISVSGTCTATFKVNTTALGGTANAVSSSEQSQAHASTNIFAADDDIVLTVSSNSSCADMSWSIKYTRTLS